MAQNCSRCGGSPRLARKKFCKTCYDKLVKAGLRIIADQKWVKEAKDE